MAKGIILLGTTVGSLVGGYAPALWGDSSGFSAVSLLLGTIGAIAGLWFGYKLTQYIDE